MAKVISKNKDAFFGFEIIDIFESGIQLSGWEIKSIREGKVNLKGAFCSFKGNELFISNMHVNVYMNVPGDETRPRKLLLHKSQLKKLKQWVRTKGNSIVATTLKWSKSGYVKVDVAMAKGKNKADKRQTIKKRDMERDLHTKYKGM